MKKESILRDKSYAFAIQIVKLSRHLQQEKSEYILTKQVLRSGTAIGALIREAEYAQSKADFINKLHIALKEANETFYWLLLLRDSEYLDIEKFTSSHYNCNELISLLVSSIKTLKRSTLSS